MTRPRTILTLLLLSAAPAAAGPEHDHRRRPPSDDAAPRPLLELRATLIKGGAAAARKEPTRFRALCDDDGYPLVGNIASKGDMYQPSQFCAEEVRKVKRT
jgi:hypothetical protein